MYNLAHRILKKLDPELSHNISIKALKLGIYPKIICKNTEILEQTIWGRTFKTPIGLSAGFDKNAEVINPILNLGFSFTELGTVTPLPQKGNSKPRIHRFPAQKALINSLGFNNKGMDVFERNINNSNLKENFQDKIIGINIGNNKDTVEILDDLKKLFDRLYRLGDYIVINLSSISLISLANDVDGLILTNTTINKSMVNEKLEGGVSGRPLFLKSNELIRDFYTLTSGKIKIIGVGGIFDANDILTKMKLGASLIQIYSSFTYEGPYHVKKMTYDLMNLIQQQGFRSISEVIGQYS